MLEPKPDGIDDRVLGSVVLPDLHEYEVTVQVAGRELVKRFPRQGHPRRAGDQKRRRRPG
jgi:hypothetical protein